MTARNFSSAADPDARPEFRIWLDLHADPPCIGVAGEIDQLTCAAFRHALADAHVVNPRSIALDFRLVTFMGSTGLREITRILPGLETMEIRSPAAGVRHLLELGNLGDRVVVVD